MSVPVGDIFCRQFPGSDNEEVFRVLFFGRLSEIKRSCYNGFPVDNDNLVVRDRMG